MTETNYKLSVTSLEFKDPAPFSNATMSATTLTDRQYVFEMLSSTQTKKELGIIKTIHHGQSKINAGTSSTKDIIPFFETGVSTGGTLVKKFIGRIVLHITYVSTSNNSTIPELLRLVGTQQSASELSASVAKDTATAIASDGLLGTYANIYKSNFLIDGYNITTTNTTQKVIIDLNKEFKETDKNIALGLEFKNAPVAGTQIYIDAYTEVITV